MNYEILKLIISPFTNVNFSLFDGDLIVNLGVRYDWIETLNGANWDSNDSAGLPAYHNEYDTNSSGSFSPKIGVAWHPDNFTTLRISGGKGFRAPSVLELHKVHIRGGGTYYREANPELEPEKIWSYDVGAERFLMNNLWGKLSLYKSFAKDYIGDRLLGTGIFSNGKIRYQYKLDNISKVDIHGMEMEFQWYPKNDLTFFTNYTYNVSKVSKDENNAELEGNYLTDDPRHNYHIGTRYHNTNIINATFVANYYDNICFDSENTLNIGNYWTLDVSVSRMFFNQYTFYINVENIFDKEYPIFLSPAAGNTIAPGMIGSFGVGYKF